QVLQIGLSCTSHVPLSTEITLSLHAAGVASPSNASPNVACASSRNGATAAANNACSAEVSSATSQPSLARACRAASSSCSCSSRWNATASLTAPSIADLSGCGQASNVSR